MTYLESIAAFIDTKFDLSRCAQYRIYPKSVHTNGGCTALIYQGEAQDMIVASAGYGFTGEPFSAGGGQWVVGLEDHENGCAIRQVFPFTAPRTVLREKRTVGVGDRLGIATPGHIRVFEQYDAYPVFAQQSMRELNLTGRNYEDVLDCASFAVFREDYQRGFGADGDHLKTPEEVEYALACGYTMITLDCSEYIRNEASAYSDEMVARAYVPDAGLEERYVGKCFQVGAYAVHFAAPAFRRMCLIYNAAIDFAVSIYERFIHGRDVDFEISIDETQTPTQPEQHFYVANELMRRGVRPATIAPRFIGAFQKGIDYIGSLNEFEADFQIHAAIADTFGYKLSIHSGSDKFSVFPIVGKATSGRFHVKTAGTSWLEAMAVVAAHSPGLYREIHSFVLPDAFYEAEKYYHVTTNLNNIPDLCTLHDEELPTLLQNNDERQLIHITYGPILNAKRPDGSYRFRSRLFDLWRQYQDQYAARLERHIGSHLQLLYQHIH